MAGKIAGITIEIGADTSGLTRSLKDVNSSLKTTQNALKDVNKLLKVDPTNIDLLRQKQALLKDAVSQTKEKLAALRVEQAKMDAAGVDKNSDKYRALQREIIETEQALKKAQAAANGFHPSLERIKASAQKASEGLKEAAAKTRALSTAAAAALTSIGALGYKAMTTADDLLTLSRNTGFTTAEIQKMQYAADRIDVSFETISGALKKFKSKIDPSNKSLQKLGVSTQNADGSLRNATDVFFDAVEALSKIENETERDQLAMELFGKSADELSGIIDDGGAALKAYGEEAEKAGAIMDEETLESLGKMNDEVDKLKAQGMATLIKTGAKALQALSPVLQQVATAIGKVFEWISSLSPETIKIIAIVLAAVAALSPLLSVLSAVAGAIAFLASPIGLAIAAIVALIAIGVTLYKNWDTIKAKANDVAKNVKMSWNNLKTAVVTAVNNTKTAVINGWNNIKTSVSNAASSVLSKVQSAFAGVTGAISAPFNSAKSAVLNAINAIKGFFPVNLGKLFNLKIPHITVTGGVAPYGIGGQGSLPKFNVTWNRRAMINPILLNGATIFGAMGNKLLGGGEAGKEVILSYDKLREMGGTTNINIVVNPSKGMNEAQLADKVARAIQQQINRRGAVWA